MPNIYLPFHITFKVERFYATTHNATFLNHRITLTFQDPSQNYVSKASGSSKTILAKHIPSFVTRFELYDSLRTYGRILSCKVFTDKVAGDGTGAGAKESFALIQFERQDVADFVMKDLDGAEFGGSVIEMTQLEKNAQHVSSLISSNESNPQNQHQNQHHQQSTPPRPGPPPLSNLSLGPSLISTWTREKTPITIKPMYMSPTDHNMSPLKSGWTSPSVESPNKPPSVTGSNQSPLGQERDVSSFQKKSPVLRQESPTMASHQLQTPPLPPTSDDPFADVLRFMPMNNFLKITSPQQGPAGGGGTAPAGAQVPPLAVPAVPAPSSEAQGHSATRHHHLHPIPPSELDPRNLYVKNLPLSIDSTALFNLFRPYGKIISAKVMRDEETGVSKRFGFVSFEKDVMAFAAIEALNGRVVGDGGGGSVGGSGGSGSGNRGTPLVVCVAEPKGFRERKMMVVFGASG
ncbi:hypothetical protein HDU76_006291 [Blyttiomyces sp. JEL0837]|nr:hypothetical protein HDU76_006291 [Blyttiomyces sp. JEL0837]